MGFACPSRSLIHPLLQVRHAQLTLSSGPANVTEGLLGPNSASVFDAGSLSPMDDSSHFGQACSREVLGRWQKMQVFIFSSDNAVSVCSRSARFVTTVLFEDN